MKKYVVIACAALAFAGCRSDDSDRGGMRDSSESQTGTYERSIQTTNGSIQRTNGNTGAPANSSGTQNGTSSEK